MTEYANFRQRLDAVLRTLDIKQVSDFLIAEKQWSPGTPADPEAAMWIMIAGSPTLRDLHEHAYEWLVSHGHEEDAKRFLKQGSEIGTSGQRQHKSKGAKQQSRSKK
ncbi:MAG TPA: hypothetical protein VFA10_20665 [Ktedonobacteraceae bacterium]|jgi:hypothetical protein|nr:hypothetical protein [Ktedonobacteraceae bacterium]